MMSRLKMKKIIDCVNLATCLYIKKSDNLTDVNILNI